MSEWPELTMLMRRGALRPSLLVFGIEGPDEELVAPAFMPRILKDRWRRGSVFDAYAFDQQRNITRFGRVKLREGLEAPERLLRIEPIELEAA